MFDLIKNSTLHQPTTWRIVEEKSIMINNDEWISYQLTQPEYDHTKHQVVRPVYKVEVDKGLNFTYHGRRPYGDEPNSDPAITHFIDSIYQLLRSLVFSAILNITYGEAICIIIGTEFYDCMSGGMDRQKINIILKLIEMYPESFDMNSYVYPGDEGEDSIITLGDWFKEVSKRKNTSDELFKLLEE
jgi:hypothetical protein